MVKILMVEDNKDIVEILKPYFDNEGFQVDYAYDGKRAIELFEHKEYDLILLDIMLPFLDGHSLCKKFIEEKGSKVIMLTAKSHESDIKTALELGAIDYIMKPFIPNQVIAKIKAFMISKEKNYIYFEGFKIEPKKNFVYNPNYELGLTKRESHLLSILLMAPDVIHKKESLIEAIWGIDYNLESRTLDSLVKRVRKKLLNSDAKFIIKTIWGVGYKIEKNDK